MPVGNPQLDRLRRLLDHLRARFERFISGEAPSDPLYLTNRTWQQKLKIGVLAALPVILLIALVMIGVTGVFRFHRADSYQPPLTAAQPLKLTPADLEVVSIRIAREANAPVVTGTIRNNTNHKVDSAGITYYLTDKGGAMLSTDTIDVPNVPAHSSVAFSAPLGKANAEYVLVRDVHPN